MEYVRVHLLDLPGTIKGFTVKIDEDSFDIFINAHLCNEAQCQVYDHEINHINNNDFDHMYNVNQLEELAHAV